MIPLRDENPQVLIPLVTWGIIAANLFAWVSIQGLGADPSLARSVCSLGLIPGELLGTVPLGTQTRVSQTAVCVLGDAAWHTLFTSMFMHGGWMHILGNMWFLWVFGDNVEDAMGHLRFVVFYLLCGLGAAAAQIYADPTSSVPMVGASGAIGGVMGAYVLLYPRVRVQMIVILGFYVTTVAVPAFLMLGYWFVAQLIGGFGSLGSTGGGVAFWAHVGGFAAGALLILPFRRRDLLARHPYRGWSRSSRRAR